MNFYCVVSTTTFHLNWECFLSDRFIIVAVSVTIPFHILSMPVHCSSQGSNSLTIVSKVQVCFVSQKNYLGEKH